MGRKEKLLAVKDSLDLQMVKSSLNKQQEIISKKSNSGKSRRKEIISCMYLVFKQMKVAGKRERTIYDNERYMTDYTVKTGHVYLDEIKVQSMYDWLDQQGEVKNSSKQIRLKSVKAVLGKFYQDGWIKSEFWQDVTVKVDKSVKKPASDSDVRNTRSIN